MGHNAIINPLEVPYLTLKFALIFMGHPVYLNSKKQIWDFLKDFVERTAYWI